MSAYAYAVEVGPNRALFLDHARAEAYAADHRGAVVPLVPAGEPVGVGSGVTPVVPPPAPEA